MILAGKKPCHRLREKGIAGIKFLQVSNKNINHPRKLFTTPYLDGK